MTGRQVKSFACIMSRASRTVALEAMVVTLPCLPDEDVQARQLPSQCLEELFSEHDTRRGCSDRPLTAEALVADEVADLPERPHIGELARVEVAVTVGGGGGVVEVESAVGARRVGRWPGGARCRRARCRVVRRGSQRNGSQGRGGDPRAVSPIAKAGSCRPDRDRRLTRPSALLALHKLQHDLGDGTAHALASRSVRPRAWRSEGKQARYLATSVLVAGRVIYLGCRQVAAFDEDLKGDGDVFDWDVSGRVRRPPCQGWEPGPSCGRSSRMSSRRWSAISRTRARNSLSFATRCRRSAWRSACRKRAETEMTRPRGTHVAWPRDGSSRSGSHDDDQLRR
jgi:hypothetical protein